MLHQGHADRRAIKNAVGEGLVVGTELHWIRSREFAHRHTPRKPSIHAGCRAFAGSTKDLACDGDLALGPHASLCSYPFVTS